MLRIFIRDFYIRLFYMSKADIAWTIFGLIALFIWTCFCGDILAPDVFFDGDFICYLEDIIYENQS